MISLKIRKYRPYADVTMVVNEDVEIHLGMLSEEELISLGGALWEGSEELLDLINEFSDE